MTIAQILAILALLSAFGVPQPTIDNVHNILLGAQTVAPARVYNMPSMPIENKNECVAEAVITAFNVGVSTTEFNGTPAHKFDFNLNAKGKCAEQFEVVFTSNVPIHSFGSNNEVVFTDETYGATRNIETKMQTEYGTYTFNASAGSYYILKGGTYNFTATVKAGGVVLATSTKDITI